jgi:hypothetical protein
MPGDIPELRRYLCTALVDGTLFIALPGIATVDKTALIRLRTERVVSM